MEEIITENNEKLSIITIDNFTGEGTDDLRLEIESQHCSAWIHLTDDEVIKLRDKLNEWIDN